MGNENGWVWCHGWPRWYGWWWWYGLDGGVVDGQDGGGGVMIATPGNTDAERGLPVTAWAGPHPWAELGRPRYNQPATWDSQAAREIPTARVDHLGGGNFFFPSSHLRRRRRRPIFAWRVALLLCNTAEPHWS